MLLAVFFAYNMAVIGLAVGVSFVSVYVWFIVRRRDTLDAAAGFAAPTPSCSRSSSSTSSP